MLPTAYREVFIKLLKEVSDKYSNHGCNDFPVEVTDGNREQLRLLIEDIGQDDDDIQWMTEDLEQGKVIFQDYVLIDMLVGMMEKKRV